MSFLKSAINQVGRDMGKVISNQIFKDSHSTPYRRVGQNYENSTSSNFETQNLYISSEFSKAINFQTGFRPNTLINKISGVYTVIKNEANSYVSDGYLDASESASLFEMMNRFKNKIDDIYDILEFDEEGNEKELGQLTKILEKTNKLFKNTLETSYKGFKQRQLEYKIEYENVVSANLLNYLGLHLIWFGKYARGGEKSISKMVVANIVDLITFTFPITRTYLLIKGILTFPSESERVKRLRDFHLKSSELQGQRAQNYLNLL